MEVTWLVVSFVLAAETLSVKAMAAAAVSSKRLGVVIVVLCFCVDYGANGAYKTYVPMALFTIWESFEQTLLLLLGDGHHCSVTRSEGTLSLGVLYSLEGLEVGALAELIMTVYVAVVHQHPSAIEEAEYAAALNSLAGVLTEAGLQFPSGTVVEVAGDKLTDAFLALALGFDFFHCFAHNAPPFF